MDNTFKSFQLRTVVDSVNIFEDTLTIDGSVTLNTGYGNDYMFKPRILEIGDFYLVSGKIHHLRFTETAEGVGTISQIAESHAGATSNCVDSMTFMDVTGGALDLTTETGYYACKHADGQVHAGGLDLTNLNTVGYTEVTLTGAGAYDASIKGAVFGLAKRYMLLPFGTSILGYEFNTGTKQFNTAAGLTFNPIGTTVVAVTSIVRVPDSDFIYVSARVDDTTPENKMHIMIVGIDTGSSELRIIPAPATVLDGYLVPQVEVPSHYLSTKNNLPLVFMGDFLAITYPGAKNATLVELPKQGACRETGCHKCVGTLSGNCEHCMDGFYLEINDISPQAGKECLSKCYTGQNRNGLNQCSNCLDSIPYC